MFNKTSRCPYRAFGCHLRVILVFAILCRASQIMLNHVIHVRSCNSCQIMEFISDH
jgi:hypothetical protein